MVLIVTQGEQGLRRVRLKFLRILQSTFCSLSRSFVVKVEKGDHARKPRPGDRKRGVKLHGPLIKTDGFSCGLATLYGRSAACLKSQAAQVCIVSLWIVCWFNCQGSLLTPG